VKVYRWDSEKDRLLRETRGISFGNVLASVLAGNVLDDIKHPHSGRYPGQRVLIVEIDRYAYLVPYVEQGQEVFWKTIIPSRKMTRKYLRGESHG
jgi:hypothetical protein